MIVASFDLGFSCGYGVLGRKICRSGTLRLKGGSPHNMGLACRSLHEVVTRICNEYHPDVLTCADPHIARKATVIALCSVFGLYVQFQKCALDLGIPFHPCNESDARHAFLGKVPRKSEDIKQAVMHGCRLRNWPATDNHAGDALCVADFVLAKLDKGAGWNRTPLGANA